MCISSKACGDMRILLKSVQLGEGTCVCCSERVLVVCQEICIAFLQNFNGIHMCMCMYIYLLFGVHGWFNLLDCRQFFIDISGNRNAWIQVNKFNFE